MLGRSVSRVVPAVAAALTLSAVAAPALAQAEATAHAAGASISVKATDFHFALSKSSAAPGKVTFKITNASPVAHDFKISGHKSPMVQPHKTISFSVTLKKGSYQYMCTVPGHAAAGMKGVFKVT